MNIIHLNQYIEQEIAEKEHYAAMLDKGQVREECIEDVTAIYEMHEELAEMLEDYRDKCKSIYETMLKKIDFESDWLRDTYTEEEGITLANVKIAFGSLRKYLKEQLKNE